MMRALKARDWGAGAVMNAHDAKLEAEAGMVKTAGDVTDYGAPVVTLRRAVPIDWLDYNGHMNESRYLNAFSLATDRFMEIIGCDQEYIANGGSYFTAETHLRHLGEAHLGDRIEVRTTVLMGEGKKMHLWNEMYVGDSLVATGEHMLIHVSLETRRPSPPAPEIEAELVRFAEGHAALPKPDGAGRGVGAPR
jgi:carnitine 3-dehydrogenase